MRGLGGLNWRTLAAAAIAGSGLLIATTGAQAHDDDRWHDRWRSERHHHHDHWRHGPPRRVFVERQPVFVAPAPVMMAPMAPYYSQPVDPSLNFNFTIPLR